MTAFDPHAATEAFLSAASAAARLKAIHYTQGAHWLLLWGWLASVTASVVIARSGVLPKLSRAVQAARPRPRLFAFLAVAAFAMLDFIIEAPWTTYAQWWREKSYGLTSQAFGGWLGEQALQALIGAVIAGVAFMGLYSLMRRSPKRWWLWGGGLVGLFWMVLMVISPILIEPLFNTYTPAPPGPTRDAVVALARQAGVPSDKIFVYNGSKQSNRYTANVAGLFGSARVAMSDVMFAKGADIAEVRGVVGHEMGHYVRGHVINEAVFYSAIGLLAFFLAMRTFPLVDRWVRTGAVDIADPVGYPSLIIVVITLMLILTPVTSFMSRADETDADAFSMQYAKEPTGLARALVKTLEYRADSPGAVEEFLFYDHPSVRRRVQTAMDWKAAHLTEALAQESADGVKP